MNTGCSARHATHHEAKTLTRETSPTRSALDRPSARPFTAGNVNCGTGLPISADGISLGSRLWLSAQADVIAIAAQATIRKNERNRREWRPFGSETPERIRSSAF